MKKVLLIFITVVIAFVNIENCYAVKNTIVTYPQQSFTLSSDAEQEKAFREWAAKLVERYLSDEYAAIDAQGNIKHDKSIGQLIKATKNGAEAITNTKAGNKSQYAPYYWIALAKTKFDSEKGNGFVNIFGDERGVIDYSNYDLSKEPSKRQELYLWILKETMKEQVATNPDLIRNSNYVEQNYGYYVFDSQTGTMQIDKTLTFQASISETNARASIEKAMVSALDVTLKSVNAYFQFKEELANLTSSVTATLNKQVDFQTLKSELIHSMIDAVISAATKCLDTAVEEFRKKSTDSMKNVMTEILAAELANMVINGKRNVIGYLRSTYVDYSTLTDSSWQRAEFRQAAKDLIEQIDDIDESYQSMKNRVHDFAVNSIGMKEILSDEMIMYLIGYSFLDTLIGDAFDALQSSLNSLLKELIDKKVDNRFVKDVLKDPLVDLLAKDVIGILKDWLKAIILDAYEMLSPDEVTTKAKEKDFWKTLFDKVDEDSALYFDDFGSKIAHAAINRGCEIINNCINYQKTNKDDEQFNFEGQDALNKYAKGDYGATDDNLGMSIAVAVIATMFKPLLSEFAARYKSALQSDLQVETLKGTQKAQENDLKEITDAVDRINKQLTNYEAMDKKYISGIMTELLGFLANLAYYGNKYDIDVWGKLFDQLQYTFSQTQNGIEDKGLISYALNVLNDLIKDAGFRDLVIESFTGVNFTKAITNAETVILVTEQATSKGGESVESKVKGRSMLLKEDVLEKYPQIADTTQKCLEDSDSWAYILEVATNIISAIWDSALDFANDLYVAVHDTTEAMNGENEVSMSAQRLCIVQWNSLELQEQLRVYLTSNDRTEAYRQKGLAGVLEIDMSVTKYKHMNSKEILDPNLTPDLHHVYAVVNDILMQMTLDAVGMSGYVNFVVDANIKGYYDSTFYKKYLMDTSDDYKNYALITLNNASVRRNQVIDALKLEDGYLPEWDAFTR